MDKVVLMVLLTIVLGLSFGAANKILVVFPVPSSSHGILGDGFVRHLLGAGHEVCLNNLLAPYDLAQWFDTRLDIIILAR